MKFIENCRQWIKDHILLHIPQLPDRYRNLIVGLLVAAALFGCYYLVSDTGSMDTASVEQAIVNTFTAESYTFKSRSVVYINEEERVFAVISGEKSGENRHVSGSVLGTALNIYYVDGQLYQQDAIDGDWLRISGDWGNVTMLLAETDPQTNFNFEQLGEVVIQGHEQVEGQRTVKVSCSPVLSDVWIEEYFSDINYTLWISTRSNYLIKAEITAVLREDPNASLMIENYFADFGDKITINAPI